MASSKLLSRISAVGLQYVGFLCAILVVFGPSMSLVNASPYKLDFFKPCDPNGWNKNFHEGHTQEQAPSTPKPPMGVATTTLPPATTPVPTVSTPKGSTLPPFTEGTPPTKPSGEDHVHEVAVPGTGVSDAATGHGARPPGLGDVTDDDKPEQIGNYNVISVKCKAKGANRKVAFTPGEHHASNFHYVTPNDDRQKSNGYGVFATSFPKLPEDLIGLPEFQTKLRGVLDSGPAGKAGKGGTVVETTTTRGKPRRSKRNHENGGKWDWSYLGPAAQFPTTYLPVYLNEGAMYSQGVSECDVKAEPKGGGGGETVYKVRILSGIAVDTTPPYGACTPEFGFIPIYNTNSKSYSFEAAGATEKDLVVTIPSGLLWEGSPKMWVDQEFAGEKDVWYNDWSKERQLVVEKITTAWNAAVKGINLQLAPDNNDWLEIPIPIPAGHSIRVYQSAAMCGKYGVLGHVTGVRLFKDGACVAPPPQLFYLDTLRLGKCDTCKGLDSCKGPGECNAQCDGILKLFDSKFFLH